MRPPVALARKRPVLELVNFITVGLLPSQLRRMYGLSWDPLRALALCGGAEYAKRVLVPLAPRRLRLVPSARAAWRGGPTRRRWGQAARTGRVGVRRGPRRLAAWGVRRGSGWSDTRMPHACVRAATIESSPVTAMHVWRET